MDSFTQIALLSSGAVLVVQQILKLRVVPVAFANHYPVPANLLLSLVATLVVKWQDLANLTNWKSWVTFFGITAVVAAITYNQLIGKSAELKAMEGEK